MLTLTAGPAALRVDRARGGRLRSLVVHGHELLVQPDVGPGGGPSDPLQSGCYPMAPFAGRTRGGRFTWAGQLHELTTNHAGHAMHGTVYDRRWVVEAADDDHLRLRADLRPGWPFEGWAVQEVSLAPTHVVLRLEVHAGSEAFPATAGWHPWFRRQLAVGGRLEVALDAKRWFRRDADGLPTGQVDAPPPHGPWDDCFTAVTWPVHLRWPGALEVTMTSTCDHLVLYDEPAHAICVEPQSGPPDALNHLEWARIVRPDAPLVIELALAWTQPGSGSGPPDTDRVDAHA